MNESGTAAFRKNSTWLGYYPTVSISHIARQTNRYIANNNEAKNSLVMFATFAVSKISLQIQLIDYRLVTFTKENVKIKLQHQP